MEQSDMGYFGKKYCWNEWDCCERFFIELRFVCPCAKFIKIKLRVLLLNHQASDDPLKWIPDNSLNI